VVFLGRARPAAPATKLLDDTERLAEASALADLMADEPFLERCGALLAGAAGPAAAAAKADRLKEQYRGLVAAASRRRLGAERPELAVGVIVAALVEHYAAPHLRPTSVLKRRGSGRGAMTSACWSLRALLSYAEETIGALPPPPVTASGLGLPSRERVAGS